MLQRVVGTFPVEREKVRFFQAGLLWKIDDETDISSGGRVKLPRSVRLKIFRVRAYLTVRIDAKLGRWLALIACISFTLAVWDIISNALPQKLKSEWPLGWTRPILPPDWMAPWGIALSVFAFVCVVALRYGKFFRLTHFTVCFSNDAEIAKRIVGANPLRGYVMVTSDFQRLDMAIAGWIRGCQIPDETPRVIYLKTGMNTVGKMLGSAPIGLAELIRNSLQDEHFTNASVVVRHGNQSRLTAGTENNPIVGVDLNRRTLALYRTPLRFYLALIVAALSAATLAHLNWLNNREYPKILLSTIALLIAGATVTFHREVVTKKLINWLAAPAMVPFRAFKEIWIRPEFLASDGKQPTWKLSKEVNSWRFEPSKVVFTSPQELIHIGLLLGVESFLHLVHILK